MVTELKKKGTCKALESIPEELDLNKFLGLLSILEKCSFCTGNPDRHFMEMARYRKNKYLSVSGKVNAIVETGVAIYWAKNLFRKIFVPLVAMSLLLVNIRFLNVLSTGHSYV